MPLYTYNCEEHGRVTEFRHVVDREQPCECPTCHKPSYFTPDFQTQPPILKGAGFYVNDYPKSKAE